MDKQLEKLDKVFGILNEDRITKEEVGEFFGALTQVIKGMKNDYATSFKGLNEKVSQAQVSHKEDVLKNLSGIESKLENLVSKTAQNKDAILNELHLEIEALYSSIPAPVDLASVFAKIKEIESKQIPADSPEQVVDKVNSSSTRVKASQVEGLEDIERIAKANQVAVPVTTTIFFKNGSQIGRAKNINIIEGNNVSANVYQVGDVMNISLTSTASGSGNFATEEIPSGAIDGNNTTFTLAHTPTVGSVKLYLNGARQQSGGADYSISGSTITFNNAPLTGSILLSDYQY